MVTHVFFEHAGDRAGINRLLCVDEANTAEATLCVVKKANSVSVDFLSRLHKSFGRHF